MAAPSLLALSLLLATALAGANPHSRTRRSEMVKQAFDVVYDATEQLANLPGIAPFMQAGCLFSHNGKETFVYHGSSYDAEIDNLCVRCTECEIDIGMQCHFETKRRHRCKLIRDD